MNQEYKPNLVSKPVEILGAKYLEFENEKKELIRGISVWYKQPWKAKDKDVSVGFQCEKQWVTNVTDWGKYKIMPMPCKATMRFDVIATDQAPKFYDIQF